MTCLVPDVHAIDVLAVIRRRLTDSGGWTELYHLAGMSIDELELIVERELGMGASMPGMVDR